MTVIEKQGETKSSVKLSFLEAIVQAQKEEMLRDDKVILIGEDIATYGGGALFDLFGKIDCGMLPFPKMVLPAWPLVPP